MITSGEGVMMAAMTKMTRTAYLNFRTIHREVTMPILARKKMRVGISKTRPMPSSILTVRLKKSLTVIIGSNSEPSWRKELAGEGIGDVVSEGRPADEEDRR